MTIHQDGIDIVSAKEIDKFYLWDQLHERS